MRSRDKLRVLLVSPVGEHGGAEQVFLTLAQHLPSLNVEPVLACMRPGPLADRARRQNLPVHSYRDHRYRDFHHVITGTLWLRRLIRQEGIDLVHSNLTAHLYGGPAARMTGTPEIWHIYDYPYHLDSINRWMLRIPAQFVLFATRRVESGFPQLHTLPHTVVHPVCTDVSRLRSQKARPDVRAHYGLPEGPLLMTVARMQEHKGHGYLIDAVPQVLRHHPDAVFAIVGKASGDEQERYVHQLQERCVRLCIQDRVRFLGYVPDEDLAALYREAAALVHPALSEGFGLTLLDAMALGVPVIAAAADGPAELIRSEQNGLLVATGDSAALSAAIVRLLQTPELAASLCREGRRFADGLSSAQMAQETAETYRRVVGQV